MTAGTTPREHGSDPTTIDYDVVVIGGGPVGENVADRVTRGGLRAAVVEEALVGGECSYWACMPTKALLRSTAALRWTQRLPGAREAVTGELDAAAVLARRDGFASHWHDHSQVSWLEHAGIDLHRGRGRLRGPRAVDVLGPDGSTATLVARRAVVVATGTSALLPDLPGLAEARPWTSREAAAATHVPARLAVIGGGVVAMEMATAFTGLGSRVTVLARDGVLPAAEPFAGEHVTGALLEAGASIRPGAEVRRVHRDRDGGAVHLTLADGEQVDADDLLVAIGRRPNTTGLGLESVGLSSGDWLSVDDALRVHGAEGNAPDDAPWLYAAGDVNHRVLLTHQGKYQARALGDAIVARAHAAPVDATPWGRHAVTADERAVPQVVFTEPEVASVGFTAARAHAAGLRVRVVDHDLAATAAAALHTEGYAGTARLIVDQDRDTVVGATFVGPDVAELLHAATIAVAAEVPLDRLWHAVPAFPTLSEVWLRLLESHGRPDDADAASRP